MIQLGEICTKSSSSIAQKDLENCDGVYPIYGASGLIKYVDFYQQENPYIAVVKDGAGVGRVMRLPAKSSVIGTMQYIIPNEGINVHYLAYAMEYMNLAKYYTGATIPHIYFKDYCKESLQAHNLDEQCHIALMLDKIVSLISLRKQQLAKLDELVKARFVEMFRDPIANSADTPKKPLGEICILKAGITTSADEIHEFSTQYQIPCYGGNGIRGYVKKSTQHGIYPIIGRQGALCGNVQLASGDFHATEHAVLVTPFIEVDIVWLFYLLKYLDLYRFHTGAAQPGLAVKTLNTVEVPLATIESQKVFSSFSQQIHRQKLTIQQSLDKMGILKKTLMQEYFG